MLVFFSSRGDDRLEALRLAILHAVAARSSSPENATDMMESGAQVCTLTMATIDLFLIGGEGYSISYG